MKIAICLSGHMRSYAITLPSFKEVTKDLDCDIFIHTWNKLEADTSAWHSYDGQNLPNFDIDKNEIQELYSPKELAISDQSTIKSMEGIWKHNQSYHGLYCAAFSKHAVNRLRKSYERKHNIKYDLIIFARPDVYFYNQFFEEDLDLGDVDLKYCVYFKLDSGSDVIIFTNHKGADAIGVYDYEIFDFLKHINHETCFQEYLKSKNVKLARSKYCMPRDWKIVRSWWGSDKAPDNVRSYDNESPEASDKDLAAQIIETNPSYSFYRRNNDRV